MNISFRNKEFHSFYHGIGYGTGFTSITAGANDMGGAYVSNSGNRTYTLTGTTCNTAGNGGSWTQTTAPATGDPATPPTTAGVVDTDVRAWLLSSECAIPCCENFQPLPEPLAMDDYRYGFNGMEKDDEVKGRGNSYDFGARMYDGRLGRWWSVDPMQITQPGWSPYKSFLDNPIVYVDPEGETEYITIMTININSGEVQIEKTTANRIMTDGIHPGPGWTKGNPFHASRHYYDYNTVQINVVDNSGNTISTSSASEIIYEHGVKKTENIVLWGGEKGETQIEDRSKFLEGKGFVTDMGGFTLVTKGNSIAATKIRTTAATETINIDLLVSALGGLNAGRGSTDNVLNFADAAVKIMEVFEGVTNSTPNLPAEKKAIGFTCEGSGCKGDTIKTSNLGDTIDHPQGKTKAIYEDN